MEDTTSTTTDTTSTAASVDTATSQDTTVSTQAAPAERPKSFDEAIERLKADEDAAAQEGREAATTAQTATEKAAGDITQSPARKAGPIPFDVHQTALTNARTKAVDEAKPQIEADVRKAYAWADVIEEPDREELTALYRGLKTDLIGTLTTLIDNASQHPDHAKTLRSQAARLLSAARRVQGEASAEDAEPEPDIPLEDGRAVYSAEQQRTRDDWLIRRVSAHFDQKLQPLVQDRETRAEDTRRTAALQKGREIYADYMTKPHFPEHKADVLAVMNANPSMSIGEAWAVVQETKVVPGLSGTERTAVLADLRHKAGAGTLNPQQTSTATAITPDGKFTVDRIKQFFEAGA